MRNPTIIAALAGPPWWTRWDFAPAVLVPLALMAAIYAAGLWRRRGRAGQLRSVGFFGALVALFVALVSPLDALSEQLFWVHQVQHLVLAMLVPILVMLAAPQAVLLAGLPAPLRHRALPAVIGWPPLRLTFSALTQPVIVTGLMMAVLIFWQLPRLQQAALADARLHDWMHASLLAAGLLFWWRILDRRPPPQGGSYLVRLWLLEIGWMMTSFVGGYLLSKQVVLYPAYDRFGLAVSSLADESLGGAVIWLGSTLAFLAAAIIVARRALRQAATPRGGADRSSIAQRTRAEPVARA